jgi:hypothetical protein
VRREPAIAGHVGLFSCMAAAAAVTGCHRPSQRAASIAGAPDSAGAVQLVIAEFRRLSQDNGPVAVSSFLATADSVVIYLAPSGPPGATWRPGGWFVVRGGGVVFGRLVR